MYLQPRERGGCNCRFLSLRGANSAPQKPIAEFGEPIGGGKERGKGKEGKKRKGTKGAEGTRENTPKK